MLRSETAKPAQVVSRKVSHTLTHLLHRLYRPYCPQVVSVDCNPAQSALLELKTVAIQQLDFEDAWQMFGEGVHPRIDEVYEKKLAPFLSQTSHNFWSKRLWYFKSGKHGCMVEVKGMPPVSWSGQIFVGG
jgi:hypothetical protein